MVDGPHVYEVALPLPPSINRTYALNGMQKRLYMNPVAKQWKQDAYDLLIEAGWKPLSAGSWSLTVHLCMFVCRHDIDSGLKLILDTACARLEVDDACVRHVEIDRYFVESHHPQTVNLVVVAERAEPNEHAEQCRFVYLSK